MHAFLSSGERLVLKLNFRFLTRLRLPSPSVGLHFRRCLYGYLLSIATIILLPNMICIKNTIRFR